MHYLKQALEAVATVGALLLLALAAFVVIGAVWLMWEQAHGRNPFQ